MKLSVIKLFVVVGYNFSTINGENQYESNDNMVSKFDEISGYTCARLALQLAADIATEEDVVIFH